MFILLSLRVHSHYMLLQIYPSVSGEAYDGLIQDLSHSPRAKSPHVMLSKSKKYHYGDNFAVRQQWRDYHDTSVLHPILTALEHFFEAKALGNTQRLRELAAFGKVQPKQEM